MFLVSAFLHEALISVPIHSTKLWAFGGMMGQVPLIKMTEILATFLPQGSQWGNITFWIVFCIFGQPFIILLYYEAIVSNT